MFSFTLHSATSFVHLQCEPLHGVFARPNKLIRATPGTSNGTTSGSLSVADKKLLKVSKVDEQGAVQIPLFANKRFFCSITCALLSQGVYLEIFALALLSRK